MNFCSYSSTNSIAVLFFLLLLFPCSILINFSINFLSLNNRSFYSNCANSYKEAQQSTHLTALLGHLGCQNHQWILQLPHYNQIFLWNGWVSLQIIELGYYHLFQHLISSNLLICVFFWELLVLDFSLGKTSKTSFLQVYQFPW